MRDYAKVAPQFWTGATGKALKAAGPEAVIVAMYLMTSPHANMIGIYYLPTLYLAHETGLGEGASKGLQGCIEAGFCTYEEASEYVFVHSMARFQIAESLKPEDKRCKGVENELAKVPSALLRKAFSGIYAGAFNIKIEDESEAPSKPLGSQEQEQEQEQEQKKEIRPRSPTGSRLPADWELPEDWSNWGKGKRPELDIAAEGEKFRDFWHSKAGKDARKVDWKATWRNWIRNARSPDRAQRARDDGRGDFMARAV